MIVIELSAPQTVAGRRAAWQSLWFLVRLHHLQATQPAAPLLRLDELRRQFPDAGNLRMCVSRAFRDFAAWGIRAGWGEDFTRDARLLNTEGRSQGPFWLAHGQEIVCHMEGSPADAASVAAFLGPGSDAAAPATAAPARNHVEYWMTLGGAQQAAREGRYLSALGNSGKGGKTDEAGHGALAGYKEAAALAKSHVQKSMAVLGEAGVWRRLDDLATARRTLAKLRRAVKEIGPGENGYLDAMEQILTAWCAYSARDLDGTEAILAAMRRHTARDLVVRYHPRVRFEWHNLQALIAHAHALSGARIEHSDQNERRRRAEAALEHFDHALQAAFELGSQDAAQQVAANTGLAIWLFSSEGLLETGAGRDETQALRWLLFSEWLCRASGATTFSLWNAIYLMRIARAKCPHEHHPSLAAFRRYAPVTPQSLARAGGPHHALDLLPASWHALAAQLHLDMQQGRVRHRLLQRCGLLLEFCWFSA
ncbi:MAG: hypothetical protein JO002_16515, partial [Burkholderiaceae bacterium]|nr:hypothetical protein [Burkholderiaceae bacterium]